MPKQVEFQVSKKGGPSTKCVWTAPENLQDPRWDEVVSNREEDINELAVQNLIIKIQSGARNELEVNGSEAAQNYVNDYKYNARAGGFRRPTLAAEQAKALRFTQAQIDALRAAGVKIELESEQPAA